MVTRFRVIPDILSLYVKVQDISHEEKVIVLRENLTIILYRILGNDQIWNANILSFIGSFSVNRRISTLQNRCAVDRDD